MTCFQTRSAGALTITAVLTANRGASGWLAASAPIITGKLAIRITTSRDALADRRDAPGSSNRRRIPGARPESPGAVP